MIDLLDKDLLYLIRNTHPDYEVFFLDLHYRPLEEFFQCSISRYEYVGDFTRIFYNRFSWPTDHEELLFKIKYSEYLPSNL